MKRICIIGCGAIGSLYAAHLARVAEVYTFVRREEHSRLLNAKGLRVSGGREFHSRVKAFHDPADLPPFDFAIVATKATQTKAAFAPVAHLCNKGAVFSAQNGLGSEEDIATLTKGYVIRGTTFMSGTRHSDTHVQLELDQFTWMGPFEPTHTPFSLVKELGDMMIASGLKAEALEDAKPAQWSKLIFNASVNGASALTGLPHCPLFAKEGDLGDLGALVHALMDEGKQVAAALGIRLYEDPWEMNKIGAQTNHPTSMLYDVQHKLPTEVDYLSGAIAREARRARFSAPLHTAVYRLIKGKEASWNWEEEPSKHERKDDHAASA